MSNTSTILTNGTTTDFNTTLDEASKSLYDAGSTNFEPAEDMGSLSSDSGFHSQEITTWEDVIEALRL